MHWPKQESYLLAKTTVFMFLVFPITGKISLYTCTVLLVNALPSTQPDYLVGMTFSLILISFLTLKNSRTLSITVAYLKHAFCIYSNACKL